MLLDYHNKVKNIMNIPKDRQNTENFKEKLNTLKEDAKNNLFDITACKCKIFRLCKCPIEQNIPYIERKFIIDQRTTRKFGIAGLDFVTTKKMQRRQREDNRK